MATNEYGLDCNYFKKNLEHISAGIERYTPSEMFRALTNLMMTAANQAEYVVKMHVTFDKGIGYTEENVTETGVKLLEFLRELHERAETPESPDVDTIFELTQHLPSSSVIGTLKRCDCEIGNILDCVELHPDHREAIEDLHKQIKEQLS